jgi:hypothetical protein
MGIPKMGRCGRNAFVEKNLKINDEEVSFYKA